MGGNVMFGNESASAIDLMVDSRSEISQVILHDLEKLNSSFEKRHGYFLWDPDCLKKTNLYFSGSSMHFFDGEISDEHFSRVKRYLMDVDIQVNIHDLDNFIHILEHHTPAGLINFKKTPGQIISLWKIGEKNIQIDFEFVQFRDGLPSEWSKFSHSSHWRDLELGIKGYHHKMLLQSLDAPKFIDMVVKPKTKRGKDKILFRGTHSFSISHGIREKMELVRDELGQGIVYNGTPQYRELSTAESSGITDVEKIFEHFFSHPPSEEQKSKFWSFAGTVDLILEEMGIEDARKVCNEFVQRIWGKGAQGLYRNDPSRDKAEKMIALEYICNKFGVDVQVYSEICNSYYEGYK